MVTTETYVITIKSLYDLIESGSILFTHVPFMLTDTEASTYLNLVLESPNTTNILLYEVGDNVYIVGDGVQKLMTYYFFMKHLFHLTSGTHKGISYKTLDALKETYDEHNIHCSVVKQFLTRV